MASNIPLIPSYENCFVQDTQDALLLVQAVVDQILPSAERRPQDSERADLIKSGNIFIFDERRGHIQRWTDGISWSPSRILGEFLLYREKNLDGRARGGTNSRRNSQYFESYRQGPKWPHGVRKPGIRRPQSGYTNSPISAKPCPYDAAKYIADYNLYGSLMSSEQYKENGLIKKTISIPYGDSSYRLISYYVPHDVELGLLKVPSEDGKFAQVVINPDLAVSKNVKVPIVLNSLSSPRSSVSSYSSIQSRSSINSTQSSVHSGPPMGYYDTQNSAFSNTAYSFMPQYTQQYTDESETSSRCSTARYAPLGDGYDRSMAAKQNEWMLPFQTNQKCPSGAVFPPPLPNQMSAADLNSSNYFPPQVKPQESASYDDFEPSAYEMRQFADQTGIQGSNVQLQNQLHATHLYTQESADCEPRAPSLFQSDLPKHPLSPSSSSSSIRGMSASLINAEAGGEMYAPGIKTESELASSYDDEIPIFPNAELVHNHEELVSGRR